MNSKFSTAATFFTYFNLQCRSAFKKQFIYILLFMGCMHSSPSEFMSLLGMDEYFITSKFTMPGTVVNVCKVWRKDC